MKIKIVPKKSFYKNFPEYKGKKIVFVSLYRDVNYTGGWGVYFVIGEEVDGFSVDYFKITIK